MPRNILLLQSIAINFYKTAKFPNRYIPHIEIDLGTSMLSRGRVRNSYKDWILSKTIQNPIHLTFTIKQIVEGWRIDMINVEKNFRYFKNMLNKKIFGNGYKRFGKELKMLVVKEVSIHQRLHLHTIIEMPQRINFEKFITLIKQCWEKTLFGHQQIHIEKPTSYQRELGWLTYIMKSKSKADFSECIDLDNSTCLYLR